MDSLLSNNEFITNLDGNYLNKTNGSNGSVNVPKFVCNHHAVQKNMHIENQLQHNHSNSFELNGMTTSSLSEDSGLPLTTNSSISSGDSSRFGLCKSAFEVSSPFTFNPVTYPALLKNALSYQFFSLQLIESDGEVSQFDSLETCSEGGMSGENFNTLKKVRLEPIDPPPEFQVSLHHILHDFLFVRNLINFFVVSQDSPQTTLLRSLALQNYSFKLSEDILSKVKTICSSRNSTLRTPVSITKTKSLEVLSHCGRSEKIYDSVASSSDDFNCRSPDICSQSCQHLIKFDPPYQTYDIYASDSMLSRHIDNIYDIPCDENDNSSCDSLDRSDVATLDRGTVRKVISNNQPNDVAWNTTSSNQSNQKFATNKIATNTSIAVHDCDLFSTKNRRNLTPSTHDESDATSSWRSNSKASHSFLGVNSNTSTTSSSTTTLQRRKTPSILYSPLHYHVNSNLSVGGNRPNSRNSLSSRLSSSHNSLKTTTSNKADDSIFITQAMSHDALIGREISDFYNVPIDSDIYALPIDVIRPNSALERNVKVRHSGHSVAALRKRATDAKNGFSSKSNQSMDVASSRGSLALSRFSPSFTSWRSSKAFHSRFRYARNNKRRRSQQHQLQQQHGSRTAEPMNLMLDEVKRFYTNLYSSSNESDAELAAIISNNGELNAATTSGTNIKDKSNFNNNNEMPGTKSNGMAENERNFNDTNNNTNNGNAAHLVSNSISTSKLNSASLNNNNGSEPATNSVRDNVDTKANGGKTINSKFNLTKSKNSHLKTTLSTNCIAKEADYVSTATNRNGQATSTIGGIAKKSQFSINLNLKQKFCSIFRFRKSYQSHSLVSASDRAQQRNSVADVYDSNSIEPNANASNEKKIKFSTRALPPLPPKGAIFCFDRILSVNLL